MNLKNDWHHLLRAEMGKEYFKALFDVLEKEYSQYTIFPKAEQVFHALETTSYGQTKVVLIGQDPYHGDGQAHGLSFSVPKGIKIPPSLRNIYKELHSDLNIPIANHGCLQAWAEQGVLLLNTVLTVRQGLPHSHKNIGWEIFTNKIISLLNERTEPVVFWLWGKPAAKKKQLITNQHHFVIETAHPSPLSAHRGFFGSRPFSKTNQFLCSINEREIDWQLLN